MSLSGKTRVVGIFGDPVTHSLSPCMQNAAIHASGLDAVYVPFHVTSAQLCDAMAGIRALGILGVNLTIPHKEAACSLVDELDEQAALIGAINTIVHQGGRLKGYNTDGVGLLKALKMELGVDVAGKRVLLLGAGGAARAALVALAQAGAKEIGIANRTRKRAQALVEGLASEFSGTAFAHHDLAGSLCIENKESFDLVVNTSAVGLKGESFGFCVADCLKPAGAVYDMVYAPAPTALINEAIASGRRAADGLSMLIAQGEAAFQLWFDRVPEAGAMARALKRCR